ncbi:hypothetical protein FEK35_12515 [Nocardia cyriacigeorgica]|uniref:Uncharacterized protein n=1 Tax=Nocardia cyriacigeorgica TaxID=135487 RepID=A0A5R8PEV1_9NOCA|nr:hypothetical protein FEK35_12515 [Nocardia cyriacigeorgica]
MITTVASAVGEGLSSLATSITEGVDGVLQQLQTNASGLVDTDGDGIPDNDKDGDGKPDEGAGLNLEGKQVKLEMGPDGQMKMVVTDQDGAVQEYKVELNAQGLPVVVTETSEEGGDATEGESGGDAGQTTGQTGPLPGASGGKREEDGEHKPQDYPPTDGETEEPGFVPEPIPVPVPEQTPPPEPTPPQPFDTGAELSEAGPL